MVANSCFFFFQAEDGIRDYKVTGVQTCALPIFIGLPVAFFAVLMLAGQLLSTPEGEARWVERETIKICRKETARPEAERKTQQFESVQDCDRLEFDFKQRYGENP